METSLSEMRSSKSAINTIILDYLVTSGFVGAAEKFLQESNLLKEQSVDLDHIRARVQVRDLIYTGRIEEAINAIIGINAQLLDNDANLHFRLLQLQLIEIIRTILSKSDPSPSDFRPALEFATKQLAPYAPKDAKHLDALEKTMALVIYRPDKMMPEMRALLDERLRENVAEEVNQALLIAQGQPPQAKIQGLVRARAWAEAKAREASVDVPEARLGLQVADSDHAMTT